ncbi:MAG TPA: pentapeptide repeat-containing protein, partial [Phototrophicaceae bacterium]|nr:pentapeptide repeat-containing protein [Phototrophicaceae bacterium]
MAEISRKELVLSLIQAGANPRLAGVDLSALDMTRVSLEGANLRGANMQAATARRMSRIKTRIRARVSRFCITHLLRSIVCDQGAIALMVLK